MSLSERIRGDVEAAPWVVAEIKILEAKLAAYEDDLHVDMESCILTCEAKVLAAQTETQERCAQNEMDDETKMELYLLGDVYEAARSLLRYNGVDKDRMTKAADDMDDAIEQVKDFDAGTHAFYEDK